MHRLLSGVGDDGFIEREIVRFGEVDRNRITADGRIDHSADCFKLQAAVRSGNFGNVPRETPGAIAAHLGITAVSVVKVPRPVDAFAAVAKQDEAVGADATLAMAQLCDLIARKGYAAFAVINQHEVVARTVHLGECQVHARTIKPNWKFFNRGRNSACSSRRPCATTRRERRTAFARD